MQRNMRYVVRNMSRDTRHATRLIGGIIVVVLAFQGMGAHALSVNPAILDVTVDPGTVETRIINIENDEAVAQTYVVAIQKFIPKGETGQQEFLDARDTSGLPEWMYVDKPEITLAPGQKGTMQVAIRVPADAKAGGYYAALFLSRKQLAQEQVAMLPRLGILFFVQVNGALMEKLSLQSFQTDSDKTYDNLPIGFRASILNEGNVHLTPSGSIRIKNMFGATVALIPFNADSARVMPGSERVFTTAWGKGQTPFAMGPYTATLQLDGRGFSQGVERVVHFTVIPWRSIVNFVVLLGLLMIAFFVFRKIAIVSATAKSNKGL